MGHSSALEVAVVVFRSTLIYPGWSTTLHMIDRTASGHGIGMG